MHCKRTLCHLAERRQKKLIGIFCHNIFCVFMCNVHVQYILYEYDMCIVYHAVRTKLVHLTKLLPMKMLYINKFNYSMGNPYIHARTSR